MREVGNLDGLCPRLIMSKMSLSPRLRPLKSDLKARFEYNSTTVNISSLLKY